MSIASTLPEFRADLIRKYSGPGPRYTSYPTALHFREDLALEDLLRPWRDPATAKQSLSLYAHLPFCESLCWFCGCTKVITRDKSSADRYLDHLEIELDLWMKILPDARPLAQLHLGGGTPTFLTERQLLRLGDILLSRFPAAPDAEFAVEIDPRRLTEEQVIVLHQTGFNRASLGVQDHDPIVQKAIHRIQPRELTWQAVNWLRQHGFQSINVDLIYGLPHQTVESFEVTVRDIIELRPDRIALFGYAHVPWRQPSQKIFERQPVLPNEEARLAILEASHQLLAEAGYVYIGMDHFALPEDSLTVAQQQGKLRRNFQGYSVGSDTDILALGMSGISQSPLTYHQNLKDLPTYYEALQQKRLPLKGGLHLTTDDFVRRSAIMELMCHRQLVFADFSEEHNLSFKEYFADELRTLRPLQDDGLVEINPDKLCVTPSGHYLLRNIAMHFDTHLPQHPKGYSQTI